MRAVDHVAERFPDRIEAVRRLYLSDEKFRTICDDLALAVSSLRQFERRPDAGVRPEIGDYHNLLQELEIELRDYLLAVKATYGPD